MELTGLSDRRGRLGDGRRAVGRHRQRRSRPAMGSELSGNRVADVDGQAVVDKPLGNHWKTLATHTIETMDTIKSHRTQPLKT